MARRKAADTRTLEEKSRYEQSFLQCQNLWEDNADVRPLTFHRRLGEVAAALIGADGVRLWHDQALFKEPGGRETDPHQDQPYWPIAEASPIHRRSPAPARSGAWASCRPRHPPRTDAPVGLPRHGCGDVRSVPAVHRGQR